MMMMMMMMMMSLTLQWFRKCNLHPHPQKTEEFSWPEAKLLKSSYLSGEQNIFASWEQIYLPDEKKIYLSAEQNIFACWEKKQVVRRAKRYLSNEQKYICLLSKTFICLLSKNIFVVCAKTYLLGEKRCCKYLVVDLSYWNYTKVLYHITVFFPIHCCAKYISLVSTKRLLGERLQASSLQSAKLTWDQNVEQSFWSETESE